jgi:hypothetical protein
MSIMINTLLSRIEYEFSLPNINWENGTFNDDDLDFLTKECNQDSDFDQSNKRKKMYNDMVQGNAAVIVYKCKYGQIFAILESTDQLTDIPWDLWGRILRLFSEENAKPFKIFFMANSSLREFPNKKQLIEPENINGGYTYSCNPETIVIYRAEDATRVLIHELQHSCCLDNHENSIDVKEAETEAWAELIYIAILSKGKKFIFKDLLKRQSEWMRKQNEKIKKYMIDPNSREFPWRYTIGKEDAWRRWNILSHEDMKPYINNNNSLRLTYPPNDILKDRFIVSKKSTIL